MGKIKEILLDEASAHQLAGEVAVASVIAFMKRNVEVSTEDYDYLKKMISAEVLTALGF
jgi:hypothetical protein